MIRLEGWKFRPIPILVTVLLGLGIPYVGAYLVVLVYTVIPPPPSAGSGLTWLYAQHAAQTLVALAVIFGLKFFVRADYGLHWPREKTYFGQALLWGLFFGVLMTLVDYAPDLIARTVPKFDEPLTASSIVGWLAFEGIYVGPTEEIPFRALLVTYLAATMPGRIRFLGIEMNFAGVVVALIFALAHLSSFASRPSLLAAGQQIYAFALGVFYAYWLEKSKSVVAPIIGHNVSDVTEYAILFAWIAWWH